MKIDKLIEALNQALEDKDLAIWVRDEEIKRLKAELDNRKVN